MFATLQTDRHGGHTLSLVAFRVRPATGHSVWNTAEWPTPLSINSSFSGRGLSHWPPWPPATDTDMFPTLPRKITLDDYGLLP